jgi:SRSO17 transposase
MNASMLAVAAQGIYDRFIAHFAVCFGRAEPRELFEQIIRALCAGLDERKNAWWLAEKIGLLVPQRVQSFFHSHKWDPGSLRDRLQNYIVEHFGEEDGILIGDESGVLKKGEKSAGVQRQYTGTAGGVTNCQIGVFLAYSTSKGAAIIDGELYLPGQWIQDRPRCREAGIPDTVKFQTKPQMLVSMVRHALHNGVPARWVVADEVYGNNGQLRQELEELRLGYVLTVPKNYRFLEGCEVEAQNAAAWWPNGGWKRLSAGQGSKGERLYDWAFRSLPCSIPGWERGLLIRRGIADPTDIAFFSTFKPVATPWEKLVSVAGARWNIETGFQQTKGEVGLADYEVRTYTGWYRYIMMTLVAFAYLAVTQIALRQAEGIDEKKTRHPTSRRI